MTDDNPNVFYSVGEGQLDTEITLRDVVALVMMIQQIARRDMSQRPDEVASRAFAYTDAWMTERNRPGA